MKDNRRGIRFKIIILSLTILVLGSIWLSFRTASEPLSLVITPSVPREGEPILATFVLDNPTSQPLFADYQFYANGSLLTEGSTTLASFSSESHQYAYENPLQLGEQVSFTVRTQSDYGNFDKIVSLPSYPPVIWSGMVSVAAVSTTMMSSMTTMVYYDSTFGAATAFNVGLLCSIVLIGLLTSLELTRPKLMRKTITMLGRLRLRLNTISWILFIIFIGIVYTKIAIILAT